MSRKLKQFLMSLPKDTRRRMEEFFTSLSKTQTPRVSSFESENYKGMVILKHIPIFSICEHHMMPFFGYCFVGYVPQKKLCGLSKIVRIVQFFAKRPQLQERLTQQIADFIYDKLQCLGVGVICEARHMCIEMRGVQSPGVSTVTSVMRGVFFSSSECRNEFLKIIYGQSIR